MNKHSLKHLLLFISCLFITNSCTTDDEPIEITQKKEEKNTFSIFSTPTNIQGKSNKSAIDYANGFLS